MNKNTIRSDDIEYRSVRIAEDKVCQMDEIQEIITIDKKDISRMELLHGLAAERPLVQLVFGSILTIVGLYPLKIIYGWLTLGGILYDIQILFLALVPLGIWMIKGAIRKQYFISVETQNDTRKFIFKGEIEEVEMKEFLEKANRRWNYRIIINP